MNPEKEGTGGGVRAPRLLLRGIGDPHASDTRPGLRRADPREKVRGATRLRWPAATPWRAAQAAFENALQRLYLAYQPIVAWPGGRLFGCEALVRSRLPAMARAGDLLRAARSLGRVRDLGRAVRRRALGALARLPEPVLLFVNLHADELEDPLLARCAHAHLRRRIVLEIHEEARLEGRPDLVRRLRELRRMGYRLALDDVGAGGRGIPAVSMVRPDVVKLDASLVRGVDRDGARLEAVRHIQRVCDQNGAVLICEGVESAAERNALWLSGCVLFQGFLFGRPHRRLPRLA